MVGAMGLQLPWQISSGGRGEEKGRCRVAAAWVRWLVVAKRETQARRKEGRICHPKVKYPEGGWRGSNRSAQQPKTLGFALRCAGRARCWRSARQPAVLQPLPAMAAVCGRLEERGHPLAVVVTRSVKSATLGRKGVFRSSRRSSSDWSGRLPAWAKAGLRRQPHASQRGVLVSFISQGESGKGGGAILRRWRSANLVGEPEWLEAVALKRIQGSEIEKRASCSVLSDTHAWRMP